MNKNKKLVGKFRTHKHEMIITTIRQINSKSEKGVSSKRIVLIGSPARYDPVENKQPDFQQQVEKQVGQHMHAKAPS